jgi:hypothetical protein
MSDARRGIASIGGSAMRKIRRQSRKALEHSCDFPSTSINRTTYLVPAPSSSKLRCRKSPVKNPCAAPPVGIGAIVFFMIESSGVIVRVIVFPVTPETMSGRVRCSCSKTWSCAASLVPSINSAVKLHFSAMLGSPRFLIIMCAISAHCVPSESGSLPAVSRVISPSSSGLRELHRSLNCSAELSARVFSSLKIMYGAISARMAPSKASTPKGICQTSSLTVASEMPTILASGGKKIPIAVATVSETPQDRPSATLIHRQ